MRNWNQQPSIAGRLLVLVLIFVVFGVIGALSHLSWLAVARSTVLSGVLIGCSAALVIYLLLLQRRHARPARHRPLEDLVREFEERQQKSGSPKTSPSPTETIEEGLEDPGEEEAEAADPESGPPAR